MNSETYRFIAEAVDQASNPRGEYPNRHRAYLAVRRHLEPLVRDPSEGVIAECKRLQKTGQGEISIANTLRLDVETVRDALQPDADEARG